MAISLFPDDPDPVSEASAKELVDFSARFRDTTFVYLYAECFGGTCEYAGFAFGDGRRIHDEPFRDHAGDNRPLGRLVAYLNVELGNNGCFEPLQRDFFTRTEHPQTPRPERVRLLSAKLARALGPEPARQSGRSIWSRLFGGTQKTED